MSGRATQRGFSLVEVMVAMTLGLILIAGALSVLYSSKVTYSENERIGRLQENGRGAVELMLRDLRAGGFRGCTLAPRGFNNVLANPAAYLWNFAAPVQGFDYTNPGNWTPALDAAIVNPEDGSDVLAIRTTSADLPVFILNADMAGSTVNPTINKMVGDSLAAGQTLVISNCELATVFALATPVPAIGTTATLDTGGADLVQAYITGARVTPIDTITYYIRQSGTIRNGVANPALWRIVGANPPQEIVEGVEGMQVLYGVSNGAVQRATSYVKADAVTNWNRVISVSIALLIRSVEPTSTVPDTKTYTLLDPALGATMGPFNDRYQRTLYTTTVLLRNTTN